MTAITVASEYESIVGGVKTLYLVTDANAATGYTYDTGLDSSGGKFSVRLLGTKLQNATGTDVASPTYNATTGIVTLPTISTGIHILQIVGV